MPLIIIGHSMGGLLTQILLDHGYGAAGVALDSVPAEGIKMVPVSQIKSLFPILKRPTDHLKAVGFTPQQVHQAFTNTLVPARQHLSAAQWLKRGCTL